jgi:hypothetical protein
MSLCALLQIPLAEGNSMRYAAWLLLFFRKEQKRVQPMTAKKRPALFPI